MHESKGITILGSTGTIGQNTLKVIEGHPDCFRVVALSANTNVEGLLSQCQTYAPKYAVMNDADSAQTLEQKIRKLGLDIKVLSGTEGLEYVASDDEVDFVMAAIVGAVGLLPTLAAAKSGKRILLANKEALVMSGPLLMDAVNQNGATLLPIDSEHNAIFQCLPDDYAQTGFVRSGIQSILLTASGGPFRTYTLQQLEKVTPEMACHHPNWKMGRKISVDSATMMNKGLEVIEVCRLFEVSADQIQVVIHPESIIHSMVAYADGSTLAQLGRPDMRTPIAHGLAWPKRIDSGVEPLDLFEVAQLSFEKPDENRFPCLGLAYDAISKGGTATTILNAANEVAVDAFLNKEIRFIDISKINAMTLGSVRSRKVDGLSTVLEDDAEARDVAREKIRQLH